MKLSRFSIEGAAAFSRRHFLRGVGVSIALPILPSLPPSSARAEAPTKATTGLATTATGAPLRMAFMSIPNGVQQDHWFPGDDFSLNESMTPLEGLKSHFQVIGGLDHENATPGRDGAGDHARASATFLTGARARKTAGSDIHVGISVDQVAAQKLGHLTRFPSLELSSDVVRNSGSCDSGYACAYQYNLAWSSATTPVSPEPNPRLVFERLFGAGEKGDRRKNFAIRQETERSILDFVLEETGDVQRQLGAQDRRKFDEYLTVVREMEQRLKAAERFKDFPDPDANTPAGIPPDFADYMDLMYDLLILAFQTDSTRIATLLLAYDGSNRTFPKLGIVEGHHYLTHNQRNPELAKKVANIDKYYLTCFARFLEKMSKTEDVGGSSLLHNSMIVYGGAIADGNRHTHDNLPVVLAGHGGGTLTTGRYLKATRQPMANLFVTILNLFGVEASAFGDSNGRLNQIQSAGI
jgi:BMFP domain-containing protein YqiC